MTQVEHPSAPAPAPAGGAAARLADIRAAMDQACRDAARPVGAATLIAVSKTFGAEEIWPIIAAGQRVFGENRVQETRDKWPGLRQRQAGLELHLIGPLQSNKAAEAVELFDVIHTVDRPKIAYALAEEMTRQGRRLPVFIQVNTGAEPQKAGVLPEAADAFITECRDKAGLDVRGLMCIPPVEDVPAPHFALLAEIARRNGLPGLSMGMSADFEVAIHQGATHVRVGSALFGTRPRPA
ncbi:YggS family pyridoxal phosphate-dependent enzyme [Azorhizobium doebereinerae]|uniref:YggS family pyridoxal phosphate-dependent enzyme n=1 Tax=Azorhizobium doebereinerae TaxID=281091 RepID=UPI0005514F7C|nr:YggS family pyridoxal phosphate-dependent enzyme [Azorhizobium doebereinerae]